MKKYKLETSIQLDPTGFTSKEIDGLEIQYVAEIDDHGSIEVVDSEQDAHFVSVYAHQVGGGVVCIADCKDMQTAQDLAKMIEHLIACAKLSPTFKYRYS